MPKLVPATCSVDAETVAATCSIDAETIAATYYVDVETCAATYSIELAETYYYNLFWRICRHVVETCFIEVVETYDVEVPKWI